MATDPSPNGDGFLLALRLGWAIAEARGRYRLWDNTRLVSLGALPTRRGHALPLADERSTAEQRIELEHVLGALATQAAVDPGDYHTMPGQQDGAKGRKASEQLTVLAVALNNAYSSGQADQVATAWDAVAQFIFSWDAFIQDLLAARPFGTASAYQLGRALAETYWALDPTALPNDPSSWEVVLGWHRGDEIVRLLSRVGAHFTPLTVQSITHSVKSWVELAADPSWRSQPDVVTQLGAQVRLWRDLLLTGRDPTSLVDPKTLLRRSRQIRGLLASFWPELAGLVVTALLLSGAVFFLQRPGGGHTLAGAIALLGSVGLTASSLAARAKAAAQGVMVHLRATLYQDVVDAAVTLRPLHDRKWRVGSPVTPVPGRAIDHVIVLVLENRSFDHMLGYLDHPNPGFDGLLRGGAYSNPGWDNDNAVVPVSRDAKRVLPVDPDHSHDAVMEQLGLDRSSSKGEAAANSGFVTSYERKGRGLAVPRFGGLFGFVGRWLTRPKPGDAIVGRGPLAMACQPPEHLPALASLARGFGVCTRWFSSVPGETWPNRNFLHAATSDGETNINLRWYTNPTIFDLLDRNDVSWHVYHDDTPQIWAFRKLWDTDKRRANWFEFQEFFGHVAADRLPNYSFIEPDHKPPLHSEDHEPIFGTTSVSNNQHPGNNLVRNDAYDTYPDDSLPTDFARADSLIATVYQALRNKPEVFQRSVLLITYDEHGGLYDHVPPPSGVPSPKNRPGPFTWLLARLFRREARPFDFNMLGPRVPAVVVSPYVPAATIDTVVRDHASVPATIRTLFTPNEKPLTPRDAWAAPFHTLLTRTTPRTDDLPDLSALTTSPVAAPAVGLPPTPMGATPTPATPDHYNDFVALSDKVRKKLQRHGVPEAKAATPHAGTVTAEQVSDAFRTAAARARAAPREN